MAIGQQPQRAAALPASPIPWNTNAAAGDAAPARSWPPADWPSLGQLTYTKELIVVVLLLVSLPWILGKLARHPRATGERLATRALP